MTLCCFINSHNDVPPGAQQNLSTVAHIRHLSLSLNDTLKINPSYIVPSLSLTKSFIVI